MPSTPEECGRVSDAHHVGGKILKRVPNGVADYAIAWIVNEEHGEIVALSMLDAVHDTPPDFVPADLPRASFRWGCCNGKNIVVVPMPERFPGDEFRIAAFKNAVQESLRFIRCAINVGTGSAHFPLENDIRLGDVVVGFNDRLPHGGFMKFKFMWPLGGHAEAQPLPPAMIASALYNMQLRPTAVFDQMADKLALLLDDPAINQKGSEFVLSFTQHGAENDLLFDMESEHNRGFLCDECEPEDTILRDSRDHLDSVHHYGIIATGNAHPTENLRRIMTFSNFDIFHEIKCYETSGIIDLPGIVVRGIADYGDPHRNDMWQNYALAAAMAYAAVLTNYIDENKITKGAHPDSSPDLPGDVVSARLETEWQLLADISLTEDSVSDDGSATPKSHLGRSTPEPVT